MTTENSERFKRKFCKESRQQQGADFHQLRLDKGLAKLRFL